MEDRVMTTRASSPESLLADQHRLLEATRLAWRWHGLQTRKGKPVSYMSHLLQVQGLVIDAGGNAEEAIAALLHDSLEDAPDPEERLEREEQIADRFGQAVLQIVLDCTDTTAEQTGTNKGPWRERKERYLIQLRAAKRPSRLVAACDKRHNLGDLVWDLRHEGLETLSRFNAGAAEQIWYYESLAEICASSIPPRLARELDDLVSNLRSLVDPESDGHRNT
jgi:(p)ppGpp synthase/HD superfamily hydrolase